MWGRLAWGSAGIALGSLTTFGLFIVPFEPTEFWWWGLLGGPLFLLPWSVLEVRAAWRERASRRSSSPRAVAEPAVDAGVLAELVRLVGSDGGFGNAARIGEIGADLDRRGGIALMQTHYAAVRRQTYFSQDIWHEIGSWRK